MTQPVLELRDLSVTLATDRGPLRPVDGVSFAVRPGRTLAVVGEAQRTPEVRTERGSERIDSGHESGRR